ncbi:hypothetical protein ASPZODRAFT_85850 [Penicilliopsis zonata CBS 506.65]|uniref:Uncharacterized protein n=1 Tax=Penicilliopsis zonata CBS 506.65 TaxID=1073090 RepID=A0A1L9STG4_9EURO|nr:hypothetical protein ASPZODRAFT_85850 [Penicilliopsis zonata CBS 506.65]OJJ50488.1 hypothetical protein ASPZODRAFT_85850 [Penicilliopsis zonata CBS 506.65]
MSGLPARPSLAEHSGVAARPLDAPNTTSKKKRKHRNRKRRNRRPSFLAADESDSRPVVAAASGADAAPETRSEQTFYRLGQALSSTSLESEALLDHRDQPMMRSRRESRLAQSFRPGSVTSTSFHPSHPSPASRPQHAEDSDASDAANDHTPLMRGSSYGRYGADSITNPFALTRPRRGSSGSRSLSSSRASPRGGVGVSIAMERDYDVNNPPSIPGTPKLGPEMGYDDAVVTGAEFGFSTTKSLDTGRKDSLPRSHDMLIDVDDHDLDHGIVQSPPLTTTGSTSPPPATLPDTLRRRRTVTLPVEEDVCFPTGISELADDEGAEGPRAAREEEEFSRRRGSRRRREWPDLAVLEEWSREEKEERRGDLRVKKINEPMLVEGRLRPQYRLWRREEDEAPYRFTYFNEEFQSTIHAQTFSELVQPGGSFRELFIPDPPELEDESDTDESVTHENTTNNINNTNTTATATATTTTINNHNNNNNNNVGIPVNHQGKPQQAHPRALSIISEAVSESRQSSQPSQPSSDDSSRRRRPAGTRAKRYGPRPTFWLDVLSPTDAEMRVMAKAFGIHALTAEDIMMQEAREKVELFRHYYLVNYRTFEQDPHSDNYLEPVNMYVVVFRDGVLSFHFSQTPHPANVRRRIRQLMDYLILSADWISYALIDDITDVFGPLIQAIEDEVDEIDEIIMQMHAPGKQEQQQEVVVTSSGGTVTTTTAVAPGEMLRRVGECRKKVMGMYRLLSNKADVVKGFAKRCNEQWEVAPKSEIGLYLGDIQDHIMTMTSNLAHYETILSRAHSNYLAQINILMNERQEQTADVLGKLTVLGTIVLPMNIICGMWGMNVKVPGQEIDNLWWFWSITAGLFVFAFASFYIAKRVYKIV